MQLNKSIAETYNLLKTENRGSTFPVGINRKDLQVVAENPEMQE